TSSTTGSFNTADGVGALAGNTTGGSNVALGWQAGLGLTTGSNNIMIGADGTAADDRVIRIGTQQVQTSTFIAGISGSAVTGADVVVNGSGRLGVMVSSARYKKDIKDMGGTTDALMKLRPVTFKYTNDDLGNIQYGLVAEEVEKLYPELVTYDANGKVETVRYSMLTSMLLNEVQKQNQQISQLRAQLVSAERQNAQLSATLERRVADLESAMGAGNRGNILAAAKR